MANVMTLYDESPYKGSGNLTREQFLFYEMRTTARLMKTGLDDAEIVKRIISDNLFQYQVFLDTRRTMMARYIREYYESLA